MLQIACVLAVFGVAALAQESVTLVGAGSTLPAPLYASWTETYNKRNPNLQVRYMPMSTKEGINQITHAVGDFAAGEVPLSDEQLHGAKLQIIHIPTVVVGIVPIYNLPGVAGTLKFSGSVLADIFMGHIKNWNDPKLVIGNINWNSPPDVCILTEKLNTTLRRSTSTTATWWANRCLVRSAP